MGETRISELQGPYPHIIEKKTAVNIKERREKKREKWDLFESGKEKIRF